MGIEIDPAVDPNTSRALCSIYGTSTPPTVISITMYSNMINALLGTQQLQGAVGLNSSIQSNPIQVSDLITTTKAVESALINSPSTTNLLPLHLASLQADSIVFNNWSAALGTYPITYANTPSVTAVPPPIQATTLDMSAAQFTSQSSAIASFQQAYANTYQSLATASPTEQNANDILQQLVVQPLSTVLRLASMFNAMKGLILKSGMSGLTGDLVNFSFAQLASDVSGMLVELDKLIQLGTAPLQGSMGALSQIVSSVQQQIAKVGVVTTGVMTGVSSASSMITGSRSPASPLVVPQIGQISMGLQQLGEMISWGQSTINNTLHIVDKSFQQLLQRRLGSLNERQSLMNAQAALGTITALISGVTSAIQAGTLTPSSSFIQQQNIANSILTSLQTGSQTTFIASGGQVIITPPTLPAVTPSVSRVLAAANISSTIDTVKAS
jgi:hypothetical protein